MQTNMHAWTYAHTVHIFIQIHHITHTFMHADRHVNIIICSLRNYLLPTTVAKVTYINTSMCTCSGPCIKVHVNSPITDKIYTCIASTATMLWLFRTLRMFSRPAPQNHPLSQWRSYAQSETQSEVTIIIIIGHWDEWCTRCYCSRHHDRGREMSSALGTTTVYTHTFMHRLYTHACRHANTDATTERGRSRCLLPLGQPP